jgi:O-antigen/teichoic acid export membrane protein
LIVEVILGLIILPKTFPNYRFWGTLNVPQIMRIGPYGLANHGSNLLWSVPAQALPIITVSVLASDLSGYFLINWTVVNFIFIIPRSVTTSMFVEGSHEKHEVMKISQRSLGIILAIAMPIFLFLWFFSPLVLQLFGKNYSEPRLMKILLLSIFPFSVNAIFFIFLRVLENLRAILAFSAAVAITVLASIFVFAESDNISSIAVGWLVGQMLPCGVALLLYVYSRYAQFSMPGRPDHDMGS